MMKKQLSFLLALILLLSLLAIPALAVVDKSDQFYVADYANVLTPQTEDMIVNYNGALEQQCSGAQIVVVTVDYLDGMYADEYATELFNDWGVGSSSANNGVLLLLAIQERKFWMVQGLGLSDSLTTDTINSLLDNYLAKPFDAGQYDKAVSDTFMQLLYWFDNQYGTQVVASNPAYQQSAQQQQQQQQSSDSGLSFLLTLVIILLMISILTSGLRSRRRGGGFFFPFWLGSTLGRGHRRPPHHRNPWDDDDHFGGFGGFGGGGFGGGGFGGGGFGGGSGFGGGGFSSGGGGGRR